MDAFLHTQNSLFETPASAIFTENTSKIHIRTQQMGRKWITTVEGLDEDLDLARIARSIKRTFHCAASVDKDKTGTEFLKLSGNHRDDVARWLVDVEILTEKEGKDRLVLHGA